VLKSNHPALQAPRAYPESARPGFVQKLERPQALVKAQSLAFLMFEKPELAPAAAFLEDFGMRRVSRTADRLIMRGSSGAPCIYMARRGARSRYVGAAFTVAGPAQLTILVEEAGATPLPAGAIPGGGEGRPATCCGSSPARPSSSPCRCASRCTCRPTASSTPTA
jgi:hypothetical protein